MSLASFANSLVSKKRVLSALSDFVRREDNQIFIGEKSRKHPVINDSLLAISAFRRTIEEFNHGDKEFEGEELFHPSALGGCRRAWWFSALKAPRDRKATPDDLLRQHLTFAVGTYFHVLFQNLCKRAGILERREVPIHSRKLKILGHADGILRINGMRLLLEIKTINGRNFIMLGDKPKYEHLLQIHAYMKALGLCRAAVIYFNKDTSAVREFDVVFDEEIYKEVRNRIDEHFIAVRKKLMPPKDGTRATSAPCSYCPFIGLCYTPEVLLKFQKTLHETPKETRRRLQSN